MGRSLLLVAGVVLLYGCQEASGTFMAEPNHPTLACAACHSGPSADRSLGSVPGSTCTSSRCHSDGGPSSVTIGTVTWNHRNHADTVPMRPACAGCHTHEEGTGELVASTDACSFCHAEQIQGSSPADCRVCHTELAQVAMASQQVAIDHQALPWIETGCVRCHYDLAAPSVEVHLPECENCHRDVQGVAEAGMGTNLHPSHSAVSCTSCHAGTPHEILAMSSSVELSCQDCHTLGAELTLAHQDEEHTWAEWDGCNGCHETVHQPEQAMVLGVTPDGSPHPDFKFLQGMTCRSCHTEPSPSGLAGASATTASCSACHPAGYSRIPGWWEEGAAQRLRMARAYLNRVGPMMPQAELDAVTELLEFVEVGGVAHNVSLLDTAVRDAVTRARDAASAAGGTPPGIPEFGSRARPGLCNHCHFQVDATWVSRDMPRDFHQEVVNRRSGGGP